MKVTTIVGARPQFVKAAVVSKALAEQGVEEMLVHTGQHYDAAMSKVFFEQLGLRPPAHDLGIGSAPHGEQTGRMLAAAERVLREQHPDAVLVYGDTNSTLAGGLAAAKLHIPVAHVEAGLRSFNRCMPEEINRVLVDHLSDLLFTPTETATRNLRHEGITGNQVRQVGDVMLDASRQFTVVAETLGISPADWGVETGGYLLATVHRAENTDAPKRLQAIFDGLADIAGRLPVVIPLHPRTRGLLGDAGVARYAGRITMIEPVGYLQMLVLEKNARTIATDSGGVQKEAFFFRVPCVTLRDETEWIETVELGWNTLIPPTSAEAVVDGLAAYLAATPPPLDDGAAPFGDGDSAAQIAAWLGRLVR